MSGAPYLGHHDLGRATYDYLKSLPAGAEIPTGQALELRVAQFMMFENSNAGYTADGKPRESCTPMRNGKFDRPAAKHPKLDRNIVLERFAASVTTGWFANYPADSTCEMLTANKAAIAKHVLDMGEALTDEFMRRIEQ